jgi:O-succinylbenzoate synthase
VTRGWSQPVGSPATGRPPLPAVAVADVDVVRVRLPLARPFVTASGTEHVKEALLVRAVGVDGTEGWGECPALAAPTYTAEWVDGAEAVLRRFLLPAAVAGRPAGIVGHPMAAAAVEAAVLHLRLATAGTTLPGWLGAVRDRVPCGVAVGIAGSIDDLVAEVAHHVATGYRRVKLKVRPGWDVEPVAAVRATWPDLALGVDANGVYRAHDLDGALGDLDCFGLCEIEQPLPADDLVGLAEVAAALEAPVCLDESITSVATLETALSLGAADRVNLKPARVGGVEEALRVHDLAHGRGLPLWIGGMLETGVGKAVNVALAALPGVTEPGDLPASSRWFAADVTEPWEVAPDGTMAVRPMGPVRLPPS